MGDRDLTEALWRAWAEALAVGDPEAETLRQAWIQALGRLSRSERAHLVAQLLATVLDRGELPTTH